MRYDEIILLIFQTNKQRMVLWPNPKIGPRNWNQNTSDDSAAKVNLLHITYSLLAILCEQVREDSWLADHMYYWSLHIIVAQQYQAHQWVNDVGCSNALVTGTKILAIVTDTKQTSSKEFLSERWIQFFNVKRNTNTFLVTQYTQ